MFVGSSPVEHFPYFEGKYLAVATALNGGNALATFIQMLQQWTLDLGFNMPQSKFGKPQYKDRNDLIVQFNQYFTLTHMMIYKCPIKV